METGWLADYVYHAGQFHAGLAMFADAAGRITRFSRDPADVGRARRLSRRAILPGLVNAHSHTFQRVIRGRTEHRTDASRDTFWTWREAMYHAATRLSPEDVHCAARMAFVEMLRSGITTVGEFHYLHHEPNGTPYADLALLSRLVAQAAVDCGLRIALLETAYVRAGWRLPPNPGQARFLSPRPDDFLKLVDAARAALPPGTSIGIAPHSVRAVPLDYLMEILPYARAHDLPVHMHLAEQPAEVEACLGEYGARPVELLDREGILDDRFTAIHAIHITDDEVRTIARAKAHVCACPTTERNLGDGIGPAGALVCFGTDSNTQIDLLEDARQLEYHLRLKKLERAVLAPDTARESLARRLFAYATESGAAALGAPGGSLEAGRPADFFTIDLDDLSIAGADQDSLLTNIVFAAERTAVRDVFVAGRPVIKDGRHRLEEQIVRDFSDLQRRLWA